MDTLSLPFTKIKEAYFRLSSQKVFLVWMTLALCVLFFVLTLILINNKFLITIPKRGGELREGIVGTPRFINPVLATNSQDETLTSLVFSGITKIDKDNKAVLDMAESVQKSDDGLSYTVTLKNNLFFHDGEKVTADDIIYTLSLVQNSSLKSPVKIKWEGVKIDKVSDTKVIFSLKQPYPLFERSLALGILPKHIWKNLSIEEIAQSDQNIKAIGSGPYMISGVTSVSGIPRIFTLKENKKNVLGRPYITTLTIHSYQTEKLLEQAYQNKEIDSFSVISHLATENFSRTFVSSDSITLPQTFSLFFNPNKERFLADKDIRKALAIALHKEELIKNLYGNGVGVAYTHYPFRAMSSDEPRETDNPEELIRKSAFEKKNSSSTLSLTLTIGDSEDNRKLADEVKKRWDKIGVRTTIQIFEFADLNQRVIKNRDFQVVLSGTLIEDATDLYAFWHSSQRAYPGLNIAGYASTKMDQNLEKLRGEVDETNREELENEIEQELYDEKPAIFLYHPKLLYIKSNKIYTTLPLYGINESSRFADITSWYMETERVWKFSYKQKVIVLLEGILH